jgi:hypothetical protein
LLQIIQQRGLKDRGGELERRLNGGLAAHEVGDGLRQVGVDGVGQIGFELDRFVVELLADRGDRLIALADVGPGKVDAIEVGVEQLGGSRQFFVAEVGQGILQPQ